MYRGKEIKVLMVATMVFLSVLAISNLELVKKPLQQVYKREIGFSELIDEIQSTYVSDDFTCKNFFINVNGLFGRLIGRREYNETVLTTNGMLENASGEIDISLLANGIIELEQYLKKKDYRFLYVQEPNKSDLLGKMFPEGITSYANDNADKLLLELEEANVSTFDLRPYLSATPELVKKYFFDTDHHWTYEGAFVACQELVKELHCMYPEMELDSSNIQWERWKSETLKDWFLGSRGKRVGVCFAGVDDLTYYIPLFDTKISCAIPNKKKLYKGEFKQAIVRQKYIDKKDYFHYNAYCLYIGGSYPIVQLRNLEAPSDLEIVIIGDSFTMPIYSYLSTVFKKVDVLDPRYGLNGTVIEYVEKCTPDLVLTMLSPNVFEYKEYYDIGKIVVQEERGEMCTKEYGDISIEGNKSKNNYYMIDVEPGKSYMVSFDDVILSEENTDGVVMSLYNKDTQEVITSSVIDLEFARKYNELYWSFEVPNNKSEKYALLLYAGIAGETTNIGATYYNVKLSYY